MRKLLLLLVFCLGEYVTVNGQSFTGINGTTANLPCNAPCSTFTFKIPHLKTTSDYRFDTIPYAPYPWVTATGSEEPALYNDDTYSSQVNLPFSICFYDSSYNKVVVGSNGLITFDETNASCSNAYTISPTIPNGGGTQCSQFSTYYPKASIMGAYSDLDPSPGPNSTTNASPADKKIEWRVEGTAPFRRFIASYYHVGTYGNNACGLATPNTFQIVAFESTGIIHLYFENKSCTSSTNSGRAIMGVQDYSRTRAVAGATKNATVWSESNSAYRFMPNGPNTRFVKSELLLNNTLVYTADTATTTPGMLDLTFPNICPPGTNNIYIVRTTFVDCANPSLLLVLNDTVTITKSNNLNATATTTNATCATANGSITVNVPTGNGLPPYQYSINGGPLQSGNVFTNLAAGNYTVFATDAGGCSSTLNVTVNSQSIALNGTATPTNTSCPGVNNGSIFVNDPTNGTGPYQYSINGGAYQTVNLFTGLAAGTYTIRIKDALGCVGNPITVTINNGTGLTNILTSATNASCPVAANGTISVFGPSNGTAPYQYSINGGPYQNSSVFTGLAPGSYTITVQDAIGCTNSAVITQAVSSNLSITASALASPTSCNGASNGSITVTALSGTAPYQYAVDGGPFQSSNVLTGLAAGPHSVVMTDFYGCSTGAFFVTVANGPGITATTAAANATCPGATDGSITVTPTTGTAPYQYSINGGPYQNSNVFTGLTSATYNVVVKDANGCVSASIPQTVGAGTSITATTTATLTSCPGVNDGSITVTPTSGTGPYQYAIDGGAYQNSNVFTNLAAGPHTVVVKDASGCTSLGLPQTVTAGVAITATTSASNTSCPTVNNGTITVTATSGTAPYQYAIDGGAYQNSNVFTNLAAGPHTVVVKDAIGCTTVSIPQTVTAGVAITATAAATPTGCPGVNNGSITVTPTTGTAPYQYSINGGPYQLSNVFTNLAPATYSVVVKDALGCTTAPISATVIVGSSITATTSATLTSCPTVNNGTITVTPTSGTSPYQYSINGGPNQLSNVFTNLAPATYSIVVTDAMGCTSLPISQTVTAGVAITATTTSTSTSCPGVNNGTITVTANGTAPYQYSINGGPYQLSNVFTNLAPASYSIVVLDANGCTTAPVSQTVTAGLALTANAVPTATTCNGASTGIITVTATSGIAPYQYSINGGPYQLSNVFANLAAGTYSIVMQDGGLCTTAPISVTVVAGPGLTTTVQTQTNVSCNGLTDGSVTLNVPALGAAPHQYSLDGSPFQLSPTFNGLAAGPHIINFIDNSGCSGFLNITITEPTLLVPAATVQDVKCKGDNSGVITASANGGTPPYQYSIDGITYQTGNTFNVTANGYTVYVKDANGCIKTTAVTVNEPALALSATAIAAAATCTGTADGSVTVTAVGGTAPYQYSLNGTSFQTSNVLAANVGTYTSVTVKDNNGCIAVVATPQVVSMTDNMVNNILGNDTTVCEGSSVTLQPLTNGSAPTPTFSWTGPNGYTSTSATPAVSPADTAKYYVTETWGLCSRTDSITVNVKMKPVANAGLDTTICYGTQAFLHATHTRASGAVAYLWTPSNLVQRADTANTFTDSLFNTPLQVFKIEVSDLYGCNFKVYDEINVNIRPQVGLFAGNDTIAGLGVPMNFNGVDVNGSGVNNWEWAVLAGTGVQFSSPYVQSPIVTFNNYATSGYVWENSDTIVLYGRTPEGCWGSDTIVVRVIKGPEYYMPSVFTPNGNGLNDRYRPTNVNIKQLDFFRIYNRWGEQVFSSNRIEDGWDGTYKGKPQPGGTYIWQIRAVTISGTVITKQGTVVLLR